MNNEFILTDEEYKALLDYKRNFYKIMNTFLNSRLTNRELKVKEPVYNNRYFPKTPEEFEKVLEKIVAVYSGIKKSYLLNKKNDNKKVIFRGTSTLSSQDGFLSTSPDLVVAADKTPIIFAIDNYDSPNIDISRIEDISSKNFDIETEILFVPSELIIEEEIKLSDCLELARKQGENISEDWIRRTNVEQIKCYKVSLKEKNYSSQIDVTKEELINGYESYLSNLKALKYASKESIMYKLSCDEVLKYKGKIVSYLQSEFLKCSRHLQDLQKQGKKMEEDEKMSKTPEEMLNEIEKRSSQIEKEFTALHPTIVDGKIKKYYEDQFRRFTADITQIPEQDRAKFKRASDDDFMPGALYYEEDNVRSTKVADMKSFPDFADRFAEYEQLSQNASEIRKQIEEKQKQERQKQIKQNNNIRQVEQLLGIRISPTKSNGYIDENGQVHAVFFKDQLELSIEESKIKAKLNELFGDGKIDLRTKNELQIAVINQYRVMREKAPKPTQESTKQQGVSSSSDEYEQFEVLDNTQLHPSVEQEKRKLREKYGYDDMSVAEKQDFDRKLAEYFSSKRRTPNVEQTDREKLEAQRRDLRRKQFEERAKAMGLNNEQIIDLNNLFAQQEIIEQMGREGEQFEEVGEHGMHM